MANKNNFRAASHLLMTLTVYPYTRKTWKKEVYEMLFDNMYFHVDSATLEYSKIIVDNLISNDRAMFKDVLSNFYLNKCFSLKLNYFQPGSPTNNREVYSPAKNKNRSKKLSCSSDWLLSFFPVKKTNTKGTCRKFKVFFFEFLRFFL